MSYIYDPKADPLGRPGEIIQGPAPRASKKPSDVTDFPKQEQLEMPEEFHYAEGKYHPPSLPLRSGWLPYNVALQAGKVYHYCTCGYSFSQPFCDHKCHFNPTRLRPIAFNVDQSGYYKLCQCKLSANSPFCNGTHLQLLKHHHKTYYGFQRMFQGYFAFGFIAVIAYNFYS